MGTAVMQAQDCLSPYDGLMEAVYRPVKLKSKSPPRKKSGQEKKRQLKPPPPEVVTDSGKRTFKNQGLSQNSQRQNWKSNGKEQAKNSIVMGQLTILKRGETVENMSHAMGRLGMSPPKAEFVGRPTRSAAFAPGTFVKASKTKPRPEEWAGPAFANSPAPSSLPLPKFSVRKAVASVVEERGLSEDELPEIDSSATMDLRRLLGLL